jgi:hypothetical protein
MFNFFDTAILGLLAGALIKPGQNALFCDKMHNGGIICENNGDGRNGLWAFV